jgi:predicted metal-dependent phosphoesterase TrpH
VSEQPTVSAGGARHTGGVNAADIPLMRLDLHCHSEASSDCVTPLAAFPARCRAKGIGVQAVTDHNEIWGAVALREMVVEEGRDDLTIIVGEEVSTREGEIVGLFLSEKIPAGLSPEETVAAIREQGGLVLLPHGFDPAKRHRLRPEALERVAADVDIVEIFNARVSRRKWNVAASLWAARHGVAASAGTDAHTLKDIGTAYIETPWLPVHGPQDLLAALRQEGSRADGDWTHPAIALAYKGWVFARHYYKRLAR